MMTISYKALGSFVGGKTLWQIAFLTLPSLVCEIEML